MELHGSLVGIVLQSGAPPFHGPFGAYIASLASFASVASRG